MNSASLLAPPQPTAKDNITRWAHLHGSSRALALAALSRQQTKPLLIITPSVHSANITKQELQFYEKDLPLQLFADWETLPFDHFSPHEDIISTRLATLNSLLKAQQGIVITAMSTIISRLLPAHYLQQHMLQLSVGDKLSITDFSNQLAYAGYQHVEQVLRHGEFAIRGALLDLFPAGSTVPFRIELFDDDIATIRSFDVDTQKSIDKLNKIALLPAREYPLTEESVKRFRQNWRQRFSGNPLKSPIYQAVSNGETIAGLEYYLPLFFENTAHITDYLPKDTLIIELDNNNETADQYWHEIKERYEQLHYDTSRPILKPEELFYSFEEHRQKLNQFQRIQINHSDNKAVNFSTETPPELFINEKQDQPWEALQKFLTTFSGRTLIVAESLGRREIILELLHRASIYPKPISDFKEFLTSNHPVAICHGELTQGLLARQTGIAIITENQLFAAQRTAQRRQRRQQIDPDAIIKNLAELSIGAPVVHIDFGVGRYLGLTNIENDNQKNEYVILAYAGDDKVYVPVASLDKISRYTGADSEHAPLQKLGNKQWQRTKEQTAKRAHDVAAELLAVYSKRELSTGFAFKQPTAEFNKFREAFPFIETEDQSKAIDAVIADMITPQCMDRLVCGDVGFGKTEVAMQAAFLATENNKQVAVLVPTTLLAQQHLRNFQDRFADWPVRIAGVSRLRPAKEQLQTLQGLANGTVDIVIGTHKLLSKDIKYKDLGLLIVDEEHRLGVKQKEKINALRSNVDILTLTATPIPRTLNLALAGTRDLSIIATPPAKRLAIKTFVNEYQPNIIRGAILREARRGGQVYFLHNEVSTINAFADKLADIVPEARIAVVHGQMREKQLEQVMADFYHQKFNVLVCTTIIESGIDVPSANTIIINRANHFGLAQLHQIRGRVGRSHHQAYAYLLTPDFKTLTRDAKKRLEVISSLEDLGVGFQLATHDLEIRGAGELLGEEQSGHITAIGFTLYLELLTEAVNALKQGREPDFYQSKHQATEINLPFSTLIPENWIADVSTRLSLYKRLSNCRSMEEINELKTELIDRFGLLPKATEDLIHLSELRLRTSKIGITKIDCGKTYGYLYFNEKPAIDTTKVIKLIQKAYQDYQLQGNQKLRFRIKSTETDKIFKQLDTLLTIIT